jgi:hypothetical protein
VKINFSLFSNKNKQAENSPDFWLAKDQVVNIQEPGQYRVVGWKKPLKDGAGTYLSCVFEKVGEAAEGQAPSYPQMPASQRPTHAGAGAGPTSYGRSQTTSPAAANARVQRPYPNNGTSPAATGSFDADALPF